MIRKQKSWKLIYNILAVKYLSFYKSYLHPNFLETLLEIYD